MPRINADGNEVAGIRPTALQAPIGTYAGWNLLHERFGVDRHCGANGSFIPFAATKAERDVTGDPRLSLEERYGNHDGYVEAVRSAANSLVAQSFLLPEDAAAIVAEAEASDVLVSAANEAPVAVAEPVNLTTNMRQIQLDGSGSTDPEGKTLTYSWKVTGKSAAVMNGDTATPTVQFSGYGQYTFELTVTDPEGASDTATATALYVGF
ncbi:MAG: hypothetical protein GY953_42280 [bacterium]|nr:hypothetical protein [bacterium]